MLDEEVLDGEQPLSNKEESSDYLCVWSGGETGSRDAVVVMRDRVGSREDQGLERGEEGKY